MQRSFLVLSTQWIQGLICETPGPDLALSGLKSADEQVRCFAKMRNRIGASNKRGLLVPSRPMTWERVSSFDLQSHKNIKNLYFKKWPLLWSIFNQPRDFWVSPYDLCLTGVALNCANYRLSIGLYGPESTSSQIS